MLRAGALFADLSSASPASIRESAALFAAQDHVDVAIMGAVSIHGHRTPLLASGPGAARLHALLQPLGFDIECMPRSASGDATALKLLRSVFTKGMDAVVMECLLAAEAAGLRDPLLRQMADLDRSTTRELIEMFVRTHAPAATRRLHETQAVSVQLTELGIDPIMTRAVLQRYERTIEILGAQARNPAAASGDTVFDTVLPWMLAAERSGTRA
ncbi:MAG TPA: DUF1932 domain-containing protein [Burkholderiaceae bacterium]|nr:DUF1932 domain-containing protein [Burkholderiaceae bacterium]